MKRYEKPLFILNNVDLEEIVLSSGLNIEDVHDIGVEDTLDELF